MRALLVAVLVLGLLSPDSADAATHTTGPTARCTEVSMNVSLTAGLPADQHIAGRLCVPHRRPHTIQVLVHGGSYDRTYWSLPGSDHVETAVRAGHAVLTFDHLGTGRSSWPPSTSFHTDTHQWILRQLVAALRTGQLDGHRYRHVVAVGHSIGSTIIRGVAVTHPGTFDAIVLTGESSTPNEEAFARFEAAAIYPANQDPRFAGRDLDDGYYATRPGTRAPWLYHRPGARPDAIAIDEATKEPYTFGETFPPIDANRTIDIPVLIMIGDHDQLLCGPAATDCTTTAALWTQQRHWYPDTTMRAVLLPNTGHSITGHRSAPLAARIITAWATRTSPHPAHGPGRSSRSIDCRCHRAEWARPHLGQSVTPDSAVG